MALLEKGTLSKQPIRIIETIYNADKTYAEGKVILDISATISETYGKTASVTTYPVEDSSDLAEHAMVNSNTITVSCVTSDASLNYLNFLENGVSDLVDNLAGSFLGRILGGVSKSQKVYDMLERWTDESIPLVVKSHFKKDGYKSSNGSISPWLIESLSIPRDRSTGNAIKFELTLRRVNFVSISRGSGIAGLLGDQTLKNNVKSISAGEKNPAPVSRTENSLRDNAAAQGRWQSRFSAVGGG